MGHRGPYRVILQQDSLVPSRAILSFDRRAQARPALSSESAGPSRAVLSPATERPQIKSYGGNETMGSRRLRQSSQPRAVRPPRPSSFPLLGPRPFVPRKGCLDSGSRSRVQVEYPLDRRDRPTSSLVERADAAVSKEPVEAATWLQDAVRSIVVVPESPSASVISLVAPALARQLWTEGLAFNADGVRSLPRRPVVVSTTALISELVRNGREPTNEVLLPIASRQRVMVRCRFPRSRPLPFGFARGRFPHLHLTSNSMKSVLNFLKLNTY